MHGHSKDNMKHNVTVLQFHNQSIYMDYGWALSLCQEKITVKKRKTAENQQKQNTVFNLYLYFIFETKRLHRIPCKQR